MSRKNKWCYLYVVQGCYDGEWGDLTYSENRREARNDLKDYRDNELGVPHRIIKRRELNQ